MIHRGRLFVLLLGIFIVVALSHGVFAVQPNEMLANPQEEARARSISENLRCLVCQNQSIDDSDADLAHDLRVLVRVRIQAGDTDEQVKKYIVDRYGDYVLLTPPFKPTTYLLWLGSPAILLISLYFASFMYRRSRQETFLDNGRPLSLDEKQRIAGLADLNQQKGKL